MTTEAEIVPLTPTPEQPPATRMWVVLQHLTRMRDGYTRDKTPDGRLQTARAMAERAVELRMLAADVLRETSQPSGG